MGPTHTIQHKKNGTSQQARSKIRYRQTTSSNTDRQKKTSPFSTGPHFKNNDNYTRQHYYIKSKTTSSTPPQQTYNQTPGNLTTTLHHHQQFFLTDTPSIQAPSDYGTSSHKKQNLPPPSLASATQSRKI